MKKTVWLLASGVVVYLWGWVAFAALAIAGTDDNSDAWWVAGGLFIAGTALSVAAVPVAFLCDDR